MGGRDVVDLERDGEAVRAELHPERRRLHDCEGEVAGLELGAGHVPPALDGRQPQHGAVEVDGRLEVLGGHGDEVDAGDEGGWCGGHAGGSRIGVGGQAQTGRRW